MLEGAEEAVAAAMEALVKLVHQEPYREAPQGTGEQAPVLRCVQGNAESKAVAVGPFSSHSSLIEAV